MDRALQAVIARFPDRGHAIQELARTNESFRSLCEDLATAEAALLHWEQSASAVRKARCAEYLELTRDLAFEIEAELDRRKDTGQP